MASPSRSPSADQIIKRWENMDAMKSVATNHFEEIRQNIWPSGDAFLTRDIAGAKSHQRMYDSTAEQALELLAAALIGILTNPARRWFLIKAKDERLNDVEENAVWLEQAGRDMLAVFNSTDANFAPAQHEKYIDIIAYGTAGMFIEDRPDIGPFFNTRPLSELYLEQNAINQVDTVYRMFELSARAAVKEFGEKAGEKVNAAAAADDMKKGDEIFKFIHAIQPRDDFEDDATFDRAMPISSIYVNLTEKSLISESGFPENPYVTPRWLKRAREVWGRGVGMKILGDTKMLQRVSKATIISAEKMIDPPVEVPDDGVLSPVRLNQSGITVVRADIFSRRPETIRPIKTGGDPRLGEEISQGIRDRIQAGAFSHLIRLSQDPRMTATQVLELAETTKQVLGPILGRLEVEDLGPMIERLFRIMSRGGFFSPAPEGLRGAELDIEYVSPLAREQGFDEIKGITRTLEILGLMQGFDTNVTDNFNFDKPARAAAKRLGYPRDGIRSEDTVKDIRQAKGEAQAQEMQKEDLLDAASAAAKLVPAAQQAGALGGAAGP